MVFICCDAYIVKDISNSIILANNLIKPKTAFSLYRILLSTV